MSSNHRTKSQVQEEIDRLEREWDRHDNNGRLEERDEVGKKLRALYDELAGVKLLEDGI